MVWRDNRNNGTSSYDIYGQQVNPDGTLADSNFVISAVTVEESFPRLVMDPATGGAWVAWQTNNGGSAGYDLYGRLLDSNGLLAGDSFVVETADTNQQRPVLAANVAGDTLVAWHDNRNGNWDIFMGMKLTVGGWGGVSMAHPAPALARSSWIAVAGVTTAPHSLASRRPVFGRSVPGF